MQRLAVLGPDGTYSSEAARAYLARTNKNYEILWCSKISECYESLRKKEADLAIVPLENSISGLVKETLEILNNKEIKTIDTITTPIHNYLMATSKIKLSDIRYVHSKDKVLAQCSEYLSQLNQQIQPVQQYSTSAAAVRVQHLNNPSHVAICPKRCSELYSLEIIAEKIENDKNNKTEFIIITL